MTKSAKFDDTRTNRESAKSNLRQIGKETKPHNIVPHVSSSRGEELSVPSSAIWFHGERNAEKIRYLREGIGPIKDYSLGAKSRAEG